MFLLHGRANRWKGLGVECFSSNVQPRFNIPGPVFAGREAFYDGFVLRTQHGKDVPGI